MSADYPIYIRYFEEFHGPMASMACRFGNNVPQIPLPGRSPGTIMIACYLLKGKIILATEGGNSSGRTAGNQTSLGFDSFGTGR